MKFSPNYRRWSTWKKAATSVLAVTLLLLAIGLLLPQSMINPVEGAGRNSYHPDSFWFYPWGKSVTHKGVDIFAGKGAAVLAATSGIVLFKGRMGRGGQVILMLGPKWRVHYYAHLDEFEGNLSGWVGQGEKIGTVGTTGNARGKPPHLHYTILTLIPYPWRIDDAPQGWKKMFYLNPIEDLNKI